MEVELKTLVERNDDEIVETCSAKIFEILGNHGANTRETLRILDNITRAMKIRLRCEIGTLQKELNLLEPPSRDFDKGSYTSDNI